MALTYRGHNRAGTATVGRCASDPAAFVAAKHRAGWQALTVEDDEGAEVGAIVTHPDTGRRVWWADRESGS